MQCCLFGIEAPSTLRQNQPESMTLLRRAFQNLLCILRALSPT
jgi:hypothetical protein